MIEIVKANEEHVDDIKTIEDSSFEIPWSRDSIHAEVTGNKAAVYVVALKDGKTIGYAGMWEILDEGHITNIAVHPDHRRLGAGSALLGELVERGRADGIAAMTLEVRAGNTAGIALYSRYGFIECGVRKGYYADNNEDAIIMWRTEEFS